MTEPLDIDAIRARHTRFFAKVEVSSDGCWLWKAAKTPKGYGVFGSKRAHRVAYQMFVGAIPAGATLDHLCHTNSDCAGGDTCLHRACVNPEHLEPVTVAENVLRGRSFAARNASRTHCDKGHAFTPENTRISMRNGKMRQRVCRSCLNERERNARAEGRRSH